MLIQLLIIQLLTFVALIVVLRMFFYRQLDFALGRLKRLHEENLTREEELKKELELAKKQKEEELAKAREEAEQLIKDTKVKAEKISADNFTLAKEKERKLIEEGQAELKKLEAELSSKYQERAIDFSVTMLKYSFGEKGKEALQHELLAELFTEISRLPQEKFTVRADQIKVSSAFALDSAEKQKLSAVLAEKLGGKIELAESVDPELIAGLVVQIGPLVIDGSLRNKMRKIIPYLKAVNG